MSETLVDAECIFCRIAARDIPSEVMHESDTVFAFRDTNPQAPVHILLIPKEHIASAAEIGDLHAGLLVDIVQAASHVGPDAGQSVFHLHVHLLGGRAMTWPPG